MSSNRLIKLIIAGAILAPVCFSSVGAALAQKFITRQHIINGLQIQNQHKIAPRLQKRRAPQVQRHRVVKKRAPARNSQVAVRRAPANQQLRAPARQGQVAVRRAPSNQRLRAPARQGQVALRRAPQQFRAPQRHDNANVIQRAPRVVKRRAPAIKRRAPQKFRAPAQQPPIVVQRRAPNRKPQHFNSQVASSVDLSNERAIRLEEKVAVYNNTNASVDLEILFDYDSARINPKSVHQLFALGEALMDVSLEGTKILIAGHTDAAGSFSYNANLSFQRARSVSDFLINYAGVSPSRLATEGYGEELLKYPDAPNSGQNRRVEIINLGN